MSTFRKEISSPYLWNRLILLVAVLAGFIYTWSQRSLIAGIEIVGMVLVTWALARELDVRRKYGAYIGIIFLLFRIFSFDLIPSHLSEPIYIFFLLRLVHNRSSDNEALIQAGIVLVFGLLLSTFYKNIIYLVFFFMSLYLNEGVASSLNDLIDKKLGRKTNKIREKNLIQHFFAFLAGASSGLLGFFFLISADFLLISITKIALIFILLFYATLTLIDQEEQAINRLGEVINPKKILHSQLFFVWIIFNLLFLTELSASNMSIYIGAMLSFIVYQPINANLLTKK